MAGVLQIIQERSEGKRLHARLKHILPDALAEAKCEVLQDIAPDDDELIRWYLEDYLLYPFDPAPEMAALAERRIQEIGSDLFRQVFEANQQASAIWRSIRSTISDTRIEIRGFASQHPVFWEVLRDPLNLVPIACAAQTFVHSLGGAEDAGATSRQYSGLRVLMVIARPRGAADIEYRSVAARILSQIDCRTDIEFEVLRPPTFEALAKKLRKARALGKQYTVVHFDGHGIYEDPMAKYMTSTTGTKRGYLQFEDPEHAGLADSIDGGRFAELMLKSDVPIVLLNACRSGKRESSPDTKEDGKEETAHSFGSFAEELTAAGVGAVVAMRYNLYVDTAKQFVGSIYKQLAAGMPLSEAFTDARRDLLEHPQRISAASLRNLSDWMVPTLFERHVIDIRNSPVGERSTAPAGPDLPASPTTGFVGRDGCLLKLDRAFQSANIVLLWGQVGTGKTTTATEFARWFARTGGVSGPTFFSSFREERSFPNLVEAAAALFADRWRVDGVEWLALDIVARKRLLIEQLRVSDCLWVWDNVESIAAALRKGGIEEVTELAAFFKTLADAGVKMLLTSRDRNLGWSDVPVSEIELPPLSSTERLEFAISIAGIGAQFPQQVWDPLFQFSQGNPFVLSLLVSQAMSEDINTSEGMSLFLNDIRANENTNLFDASVQSALANEFTEPEQAMLSLICLFEGTISAALLAFVAEQGEFREDAPTLSASSSESEKLLNRATALGVFQPIGAKYFSIHPGVPSSLRRIYIARYAAEERLEKERKFLFLFASLARVFARESGDGTHGAKSIAVDTLKVNELNLRSALATSRRIDDWRKVLDLVFGLQVLFDSTDRWAEFARLVEEIAPEFVNPTTGAVVAGREAAFARIQNARSSILMQEHRLDEAERIQRDVVFRLREHMSVAKKSDIESASQEPSDRDSRSSVAQAVLKLASIQKSRGSPESLKSYQEALELAQRAGDEELEGIVAYQFAGALIVDENPDLDAAGYWLAYALDLTSKDDPVARGTVLSGLGSHSYTQFQAGGPEQEAHRRLNDSIKYLETALDVLPASNTEARAACHANLGLAYFSAGGDLNRSVLSFEKALVEYERLDDEYRAGQARLNLARVFEAAGDVKRASMFADAALRNFASLAPDAESDVREAQDFVANLMERV
jgi:tetratricopeptide (TPR) repeat protein